MHRDRSVRRRPSNAPVARFANFSWIIFLTLVVRFVLLAGPSAAGAQTFDESQIRGYDYTGAYGQLGVSIGDIVSEGGSASSAVGGFLMTGGYRFLPWLSAEGHFTFLARPRNEFFAFTVGPKIHPLGFAAVDAIPHFLQPYVQIGIGGGGFSDDATGVARFMLGLDIWATDHLGFLVEGGGHSYMEGDFGREIFTVGGQYRF